MGYLFANVNYVMRILTAIYASCIQIGILCGIINLVSKKHG